MLLSVICLWRRRKSAVSSDEGFIDGEIRAAWLHSAI